MKEERTGRDGPGAEGGWNGFFPVLLLALVALGLRLLQAAQTYALLPDGAVFLRMAEAFATGEWGAGFSEAQHPGYPLLVSVLIRAGARPETAGVWTSALATAGLVPLGACLARRLARGDGKALLLAGAGLAALHPYLLRAGSVVMSDGTALFFATFSLLFGVRVLARGEKRMRGAALAGAAAGAAYLVRPEGALAGLVLGGALLARAWKKRSRRDGLRLAVLAGAFLLLAGPYLVQLRLAEGSWHLTRKKRVGQVFGIEAGSTGGETGATSSNREKRSVREAVLTERRDPRHLGRRPTTGFRALFWDGADVVEKQVAVVHPLFLILALIGMWGASRGGVSASGLYLLTVAGALLLLLGALKLNVGYLSRRHCLFQAVLFLPFAAGGLVALRGMLESRSRVRPLLLSLTLALVVAGICLPKGIRPEREEKAILSHIGRVLARETDHPPVILGREASLVTHHAGGRYLRLGDETPIQLVARAERERADWIVILSRMKTETEPAIVPLLRPAVGEPEWVWTVRENEKIYRWMAWRLDRGR